MTHTQTSSIDSMCSSLSFPSSSSSPLSSVISVRDEAFKAAVDDLKTGPRSLQSLVETATALIDTFAANEQENTFDYNGSKLQLHDVLRAMLYHAEGCGGQGGNRYTASAICLCAVHDDPDNEKTLQMLRDLAKTWVSHLLFIFHITAFHATEWNLGARTKYSLNSREREFRKQLLQRDGYRCIVTDSVDEAHPNHQGPYDVVYELKGCHIIQQAIAIHNSEGDQDVSNSAVTTFDILRNYASLSPEAIQELEDNIEDPYNGILLAVDPRYGFERFQWCLQETETRDRYKVKIYGRVYGIHGMAWTDSKFVEFKDHSEEFRADKGESLRKRGREIPLPNPCYLRIHAAVAGILNMSGAGKFFDELLKKFGRQKGCSAVRSWEGFDRVIETANLRKELSILMCPEL
ncbi:hypothetical protein D9615_007499 [Tricholomella constricta]|uniref:HNH nuclease domain-containing protein n=1 Tax=Tricholomella constricta TaxID=117010 RepID=A0A8H5H7J5_9AGAR|nr:hypothetical protein D9615_007499 [Tricholomella constricta]